MGIFGLAEKIYKGARRVFTGRRRKAVKQMRKRRNRGLKRAVTKPFTVRKTIMLDRITVVTNTTQTFTAELSDLPQYTNFTTLYDQYRIAKVTVRYRVLNNVNVITSTNGLITLGMIHSVVDHNDAITPGSIQELMNDNSYFTTKTNRDHVRSFRPMFLENVGGAAQAKSNSGWLACSSPGVSHYGLKTFFEAGSAPAGFTSYIVEPIITYYVQFKDQKN